MELENRKGKNVDGHFWQISYLIKYCSDFLSRSKRQGWESNYFAFSSFSLKKKYFPSTSTIQSAFTKSRVTRPNGIKLRL
jgi:hypothetical protein